MSKTYDRVNIDAKRLRNDIACKRFSLACVSVNVGREESWLAKRLTTNTIKRESLIDVCKLCGLKVVDYIIDTPADRELRSNGCGWRMRNCAIRTIFCARRILSCAVRFKVSTWNS